MRRVFFLPIVSIFFVLLGSCNPLITMVPKTEEILLDPVASGDYVDIATVDYIKIVNAEIKPDREIEAYYFPSSLGSYWGMIIDVEIFIAENGGELLILDDDMTNYLNRTIRLIVTWYEEEEYQHGD
jgi:hypothetical protein